VVPKQSARSDDWVEARETASVLMDQFLSKAAEDPLVLAYMAAHDVTLPKVKDLLSDIVLWRLSRKSAEAEAHDAEKHGRCCVCGHPLDLHIDEGDYWRCHALGSDGPQCECRLLKNPGLVEVPLEFYDYEKRQKEFAREVLGGLKTKEAGK